jgi:D-arginine dehydrogenase
LVQGISAQMAKIDFLVIGGGMAGASVAAELSREANVVLVEAEEQPGYHSTGRSAALFSEIYGNAPIRALSRASRPFLFDPSPDFCSVPLVHPRGTLFIARADQMERLTAYAALPDIAPATRLMTLTEMKQLCPLLREDQVAGGLYEPGSMDLEVHELHTGYLKQFRRNSGLTLTNARVTAIRREGDMWVVEAAGQKLSAPVLINAAGAWADEIATMAGVAPIGVVPHRRTAALIDAPAGVESEAWPLVIDIDEEFYVKPDAGLLLISPADETVSEPCDAQPEDIDIATAAHRIEGVIAIKVKRIKHSWAGLRSFVADRSPVAGYDPAVEGFFWLAGQGGYGIQTAPALARTAAALALGRNLPDDLIAAGVSARDIAPVRLRVSAAA